MRWWHCSRSDARSTNKRPKSSPRKRGPGSQIKSPRSKPLYRNFGIGPTWLSRCSPIPAARDKRSVAEPLRCSLCKNPVSVTFIAVEAKKATLARGLHKTSNTLLIDVELLLMHRRIRLHDDRPLREFLHF